MPTLEHFRALFDPRGVIVAGASTHPGKFGFVALHNILANGYQGEVFATNREGADVLGRPTLASIDEVPDGAADLVFVCTPAAANPEVLRQAAAKGVRAAFIASAGYGEAGEEGAGAPGRAGGAGRRPRHADRRPQRPGARVHPVVAVRPDRGALPAGGPHRRGQPVGQLRVVVHEPVPPERGRRQPGRLGRQRRPGRCHRRPGVLRRRPRDRGGSRLRRGSPRRPWASSIAWPPSPTGCRSSWSRAGPRPPGHGPRPATPARWPPTTRCSTACAARPAPIRAATVHRGVRRGRRPSPPSRAPPGRRVAVVTTVGGWGVRHRRRHRRHVPRAARPARRPPGHARRAAAPRWSRNNPIDLAGRRDQGHRPGGARGRGRPPRGRRRDPARRRHPVQPGPARA